MVWKKQNVKDAFSMVGKEVLLAGWVHEVRNIGKIKFILLRDWTGIIQIIGKKGIVDDETLSKMDVNKEWVISVKGIVKENKIAPNGVEVVPSEIQILSKTEKKLPVDPTGVVESELETRLNYRYIDLRKKEVTDVFKVKSIIAEAFRSYLRENSFIEIHPTAIVASATEGGADVFPIEYFEHKAFLAQSPQLYKQMVVVGGLERVFMTMPVFRAEKHNTTTHLNEIIQMDVEMAFFDDKDAMNLLGETVKKITQAVAKSDEIYEINENFEPVKEVKQYTYTELIDLLKENNFKIEWGEDFSREAEKKLNEILGEDAFIVYEWPKELRAFYSMPNDDGKTCKAYDLLYKGLEISSGAQRIHIPEVLEEEMKARGLNPIDFEFYIEAFRYGAPPHAGWSIGLERMTMKVANLKNIREAMLFPRDRTRLFP